MATITSAQSGNFSAVATWTGGVVPVDGDSFVIASGHTVTYDVTTPVTNGFNDSDIFGVLQTQLNATTVLRMNGRLRVRTNGTYHARKGHKLQFKGTASESHILYVLNEIGASLIMEGTDGMPSTVLSANANEKSTSFSVTSAANFAIGEWISVFDNTTSQVGNAGASTLRDEGFWIHDIDANTIFFRQFVGPTATITAAATNLLTVNNSKVFRIGQQIIFGTGANRNIRTINAINYSTHILTLSANITGTVVGQIVYETGSDKIHTTNEKVRKVATVTSTSVTSTSTTITLANASMFVADDEIWIEARSEAANNTDSNFDTYGSATGPRYRHVISSVNGNTLTLTSAIGYNVVIGSLVTRLTRDVVVEALNPNIDYFSIYTESYTTDYTRKLILKDVQIRYVGSSNSFADCGVILNNGHFGTNTNTITLTNTVPVWNQQPWIEGLAITGSNSTRDNGGLFNNIRYGQLRCCTVVGIFNSGITPTWYKEGGCAYNCITSGSNTWGFRSEHGAEWGEVAYCYSSRNLRQARIIQFETNCGFHHFIGDGGNEHSIFFATSVTPSNYKIMSTGSRYGLYTERNTIPIVYSFHKRVSGLATELSNPPGTTNRSHFHSTQLDRGTNRQFVTSLEHNFEIDAIRQFGYGTERYWDHMESAWRVLHSTELNDSGIGWFVSVYIPTNVTVIATSEIKLYNPYSGNLPIFEARDILSAISPNQLQNTGGNYSTFAAGGSQTITFTTAAQNAYETKSITIAAVPYPRNINIGVHVNNTNASEGYWMRPINIIMNKSYLFPIPEDSGVNSGFGPATGYIYVKDDLSPTKIRLGGRIY